MDTTPDADWCPWLRGRRDAPEVDITACPRMERSGTPDDEFTGKVKKKKKKKKALGAKGAGLGKDEL